MRLGGGNLLPGASLPPEYWVLEMTMADRGPGVYENTEMILQKIEQGAGEPRTFCWKKITECPDEDAWIFRTEAAANEAAKAWHRGVRVAHRSLILTTDAAMKYLGVCYLTFLKLVKKYEVTGAGGGRGGKLYRGADIAEIKRARAMERKEDQE